MAFYSCSDDDGINSGASNAVSFAVPSMNLTENSVNVIITFAQQAASSGVITLGVVETEAKYGTDYVTAPAGSSSTLEIPFDSGVSKVDFTFNKLISASEGQVKNVKFTINKISTNYEITGNNSTVVNFNETALSGNSLAPEVGGPSQENQVYIDLSSGAMTTVPRISWDLGFYSGSDFRVILNNSVKMSAKSMEDTDLSVALTEDSSMLIGQGSGIVDQIDDPTGLLTGTAIAEVSANDAENFVYLVNLGSNPSTTPPALGSVAADSGTHRGWKKIRILRNGNGYKLQYADLSATTFNEVTIDKAAAYNFNFFSFTTNQTVSVEPEKDKWDLNFTTFTNVFGGTTPYFFPDFVVNNSRGGALAYAVSTEDFAYENFTLSNVDQSQFINDQRGIGSSWRATSAQGPDGFPVSQFVLKTDIFFVLKDPAGNIYKIKMTGGALENQERGHPTFVYELL
ncbi:MAG TPA: HmuY family protein [Flavobacterium sp.]|nr:HmuY family protein [Flavobacterium sp.]